MSTRMFSPAVRSLFWPIVLPAVAALQVAGSVLSFRQGDPFNGVFGAIFALGMAIFAIDAWAEYLQHKRQREVQS